MATPDALKLLSEWKTRLGLSDWFIALYTDCHPEGDLEDSDGIVDYVESTKCASVRIINPKERKESLRPFNFEVTLVHELLHLKLSLFDGGDWDNSFKGRYAHQIVDDLARAFVDAKTK